MKHGRSVRLFLAEGTPIGLRHAEVVNWTGQAIACPRNRIQNLKQWDETLRPGVYFLLSPESATEQAQVYIGEAENVFERIGSHLKNKDFWSEVVFFTSKDENLTKAHVRYLESRLLAIAAEASRYNIKNTNSMQEPTLPRADKAAMEEYIDNVRILLGTLGHRVLELLVNSNQQDVNSEQPSEYSIKGKLFEGYGRSTDEGFVVLQGSKVSTKIAATIPSTVKRKVEQLLEDNILSDNGDQTATLQRNILFSSSSYAASFVAGSRRNGRKQWKTSDGLSLGEIEDKIVSK